MKSVAPENETKVPEKPADAGTPPTDQASQDKKTETNDTTAQPAVTAMPTPPPVATDTPETKPDVTTEQPRAAANEKPAEQEPQPTETPAQKAENTDQTAVKTSEPQTNETAKNEPSNDLTNQKSGSQSAAAEKRSDTSTSLRSIFDPVIINVPKSNPVKLASQTKSTPDAVKRDGAPAALNESKKTPENSKPHPTSGETRPRVVEEKTSAETPQKCSIGLSRDAVSIVNAAGSVGILVSLEGEGNLKALTTASSSPNDVEVILEPEIAGAADKAFYLINSISSKKGIYQVTFELSCGQKTLTVTVY
jgi:hypothetical protein